VAIYSTIDSKSPHVTEADEAVCVGPTASSASYLDVDNVCKAIEMTGAEAVHPGYGFLSENAEFARRVEKMIAPSGKSVKFIGPSSSAIVSMGDKITSKKIAKGANVNCIPGFDGFVTSQDHAVTIAQQIGYPVMIKATSGGGGKGMRICYTDAEVKEGFLLSTAEAKSFFNDERLFIEKFIEKPHHIEIQLLSGRKDGGELEILCFPERECSIQRRNQKVLEESPSPLLKPETRAEMVRQVKRLVREVDYSSAGTVEFLVDEEQNFYFLEMNTRLQVEHPVTEMVSDGCDLVYGMIEVAAGKGVPQEYLDKLGDKTGLTPEELDGLSIPHSGYAVEARIYAEDPLRGFLPATGPLLEYIEPENAVDEDDCEIRVDSGVVAGSIISQYYDPMISKLIAHSPNDRTKAIRALQKALDSYVITGIRHNCSFLIDVLRHESFIAGDTPTNFINMHYPDGFSGVSLSNTELSELAAIAATASIVRGEVLQRPQNTFQSL
jgi:propionyl-CoA carboxylase alpha chain